MSVRLRNPESGSAIVLFVLCISVLAMITALVVDAGRGFMQQRNVHFSLDAAALAGVVKLDGGTETDAYNEAYMIARENGVSAVELQNSNNIQIGTWDESAKTFQAYPSPIPSASPATSPTPMANAVQLLTTRNVDGYFTAFFGIKELLPSARSVAYMPITTVNNPLCLKPFAIESSSLISEFGDLNFIDWLNSGPYPITIGNNSPANWGKIDLGGNMSSGNNFRDAMLNGICDPSSIPAPNTLISPGTGFGGPIKSIFDSIYNDPDTTKRRMLFMRVSDFPNGNSGDISNHGFVEVEMTGLTLSNGQNWTMDLNVINIYDDYSLVPPLGPPTTGYGPRQLVY